MRMIFAASVLAGTALAQPLLAQPSLAQPAPNPLDVIPDKIPFGIPYGPPIGLDRAQVVIAAAMAEARKHSWDVNFAVLDSGGNLVAFARMDGAMIGSISNAEHKARAAVMFRRETREFENGMQNGLIYTLTVDGIIGSRGGIPLVEDGRIIGALGVSGGAGSQDEVCAKAGVAALSKSPT